MDRQDCMTAKQIKVGYHRWWAHRYVCGVCNAWQAIKKSEVQKELNHTGHSEKKL